MSDTTTPAGSTPGAAADDNGSLAERVANAAVSVPGVTGLHAGVFGEVATYLPGSRVSGVRLSENSGEVHIVVDINRDLRAVADEVVTAASQVAGVPISVVVEDISTGSAPQDDTSRDVVEGELVGGDRTAGEISPGDATRGDAAQNDAPQNEAPQNEAPQNEAQHNDGTSTRSTKVNNDD
ncbi:hypothetical protein [Gordonia aichiensis]